MPNPTRDPNTTYVSFLGGVGLSGLWGSPFPMFDGQNPTRRIRVTPRSHRVSDVGLNPPEAPKLQALNPKP